MCRNANVSSRQSRLLSQTLIKKVQDLYRETVRHWLLAVQSIPTDGGLPQRANITNQLVSFHPSRPTARITYAMSLSHSSHKGDKK
jgi:hypothetical protein